MKKRNKRIVVALLSICLVFVSFVVIGYWWMKPFILIQQTRYWAMPRICNGIVRFENDTGRLPHSLEEVVKEGYLPNESKIYNCPLLNNSMFLKSIKYDRCEYELIFKPNEVRIAIPEKVFENPKFERYDSSVIMYLKIKRGTMKP